MRFTHPRRIKRRVCVALLGCFAAISLSAQKPVSIPEEIEWTWEVRPPHPDPRLPSVLLLGDSISRNYFPEVRKDLAGVANVYLMASSTCVGDPRIEQQIAEFAAMEGVRFTVVHFNNGMHGWAYTEARYQAAFPAYLRAIEALTTRGGRLIWASTTPVRPDAKDATNLRIVARNRIAAAFVETAGIPIDDQFVLMEKHQNLHQDPVHFNAAGSEIQGDQAAAMIRKAILSDVKSRMPEALSDQIMMTLTRRRATTSAKGPLGNTNWQCGPMTTLGALSMKLASFCNSHIGCRTSTDRGNPTTHYLDMLTLTMVRRVTGYSSSSRTQ